MIIIGLTGTIGSGKSKAAQFFAELGVTILDADLFAREVVQAGSPALTEISKFFGDKILLKNGNLDRKKLGEIVFADPAKRAKLEEIVHPRIKDLFIEKLFALKNLPTPPRLVIYVIPLLFESKNKYPEISKTIVVTADKETCIKRIIARDKCSREFALAKLATQISIEEKVKLADYVLENNSTEEALRENVNKLFLKLEKL